MSNAVRGNIAESFGVVGCIDPDAYATGATNDDVVDMRYFEEVMYVVMAGTLGSSATIDFAVYGDTASNGAFSTLITGKSITQLTEAGTESDKQAIVRVTAEEVAAQGLRYLRGKLTVGAATSDCGVVTLASPSAYEPVTAYDLSSVSEVVM